MIFANSFLRVGGGLESPGVAFGEVLARFGAVSVRSGPSFGAFPSQITLWYWYLSES